MRIDFFLRLAHALITNRETAVDQFTGVQIRTSILTISQRSAFRSAWAGFGRPTARNGEGRGHTSASRCITNFTRRTIRVFRTRQFANAIGAYLIRGTRFRRRTFWVCRVLDAISFATRIPALTRHHVITSDFALAIDANFAPTAFVTGIARNDAKPPKAQHIGRTIRRRQATAYRHRRITRPRTAAAASPPLAPLASSLTSSLATCARSSR